MSTPGSEKQERNLGFHIIARSPSACEGRLSGLGQSGTGFSRQELRGAGNSGLKGLHPAQFLEDLKLTYKTRLIVPKDSIYQNNNTVDGLLYLSRQ